MSAIRGAINGDIDHDNALLGLLASAGVGANVNCGVYTNATGSESMDVFSFSLCHYLNRFGRPIPDELLTNLIRNSDNMEPWGPLLTETQKIWIAKLAADTSQSSQVCFNAQCVLFYAGDDARWWQARKMVTRPESPWKRLTAPLQTALV